MKVCLCEKGSCETKTTHYIGLRFFWRPGLAPLYQYPAVSRSETGSICRACGMSVCAPARATTPRDGGPSGLKSKKTFSIIYVPHKEEEFLTSFHQGLHVPTSRVRVPPYSVFPTHTGTGCSCIVFHGLTWMMLPRQKSWVVYHPRREHIYRLLASYTATVHTIRRFDNFNTQIDARSTARDATPKKTRT